MASWKKVIVSGSDAELNGLTLSGDLTVAGGDITLGSTSIFSGGDTTSLNNIDAIDATTEATIEAAIDTLSNLVTVGTLDSGAITSNFGNINIGTSTLDAGNTTIDTLTNDSSVAASHITGSFTGSFTGDGSGLSGVTAAVDIDSLSTGPIDQTDKLIYSDAGTEKAITFSDFEDTIFGNFSGDATVAAGGAITIAADSVEGTMLNTNVADTTTIELSSDTLSVLKVPNVLAFGAGLVDPGDFDGSSGLTLSVDSGSMVAYYSSSTFAAVSGDATIAAGGALSIANNVIDENNLTTSVAGNGLTGGNGSVLAVGAGTGVTVNANDVAIGQDVATSADVTFATVTTTGNVTVAGDLTVQGTQTSLNTTNLLVEDRFILANSGSATGDGGLIVQTEAAYSGSAFAWDDSEGRWGFQIGTKLGESATAVAPDAYASSVVTSDLADYQKNGNIRVESGEIYIYVE